MEEKLTEKVKEKIQHILDEDINTNNLEHLYKLTDIYKDIKEVESMNYGRGYGNYGNYGRGGYGEYGEYGKYYGRRGRDMKYRGEEQLETMAGEYGRYQESRRYGDGQESDKSFHYMTKALEDFIRVLYEEAETEPQKQQLRETLQRSMM